MSITTGQGGKRRRPPPIVWLVLAGLLLAMAVCAALGTLAWLENRRVQTLSAQVIALQGELQQSRRHLGSLEATATTLEDRVASLEASDPGQQIAALQRAVELADDSVQTRNLQAALREVQTIVAVFQTNLDELATRIDSQLPGNSAAVTATLPSEVRLDVTPQKQTHNLSCESSAASMVADYHDLSLPEADVLDMLPRSDNPYLGFRGNVDGPTGGIQDYGVYAGPIQTILNAQGLLALYLEGGLAGVKAAIARGNPVIAWVTYDCLPSTPVAVTVGGVAVTLVPNQHVVVVTGFTEGGVWANDPWDGVQEFYPNTDFARAMAYFDNMALEVMAP